ncbi:MAG: glycosyltransferase family 39 protein [Nitrospirota bacterium]|nr:glycosyltransferase family 39 protein [Nitrospirota bacterium]
MNDVWNKFHVRPYLHLLILVFVGYQAFVSNISLSLFGETEGLYAIVTHTMMAAGDYVHLSLRGEPYFNKPPLFFWLQALGAHALGWSELALRLPSVLASCGLIATTYGLGRVLFSSVAGFWAALVVATCYAGFWFGPLAIIDPVLTFFMTFGMYAWARAYFQESSPKWYAIGCVALALGSMVKTLHALAMPVLVIGGFLWIKRDSRVLREPWLWVGIGLFGAILGGYYVLLGQAFWQHFFFEENLQRLVAQVGDKEASAFEAYWGKRPIHWYGYAIWFDAFPWSVLLPTGLVLMWKQRPWRQASRELWVLLWVGGYLLAFSLVPEKHERYLLPLLPGIGLVVGYVYQSFCVDRPQASGHALLTWMLGLLGVAFGVAVFLGPILLQKKWFLPVETIPLAVRVWFGIGGLTLLILAIRNKIRLALLGVGVLSMGLMLAVTVWIIPGIHAEGAPKSVFLENQQRLSHPTDPIRMFQTRSWRGDEDEFYWDVYHGHFQVVGEGLEDSEALKALKQELRAHHNLVIMMTEEQYNKLIANNPYFLIGIDLKFHRSRKQIYLVSLQERKATL